MTSHKAKSSKITKKSNVPKGGRATRPKTEPMQLPDSKQTYHGRTKNPTVPNSTGTGGKKARYMPYGREVYREGAGQATTPAKGGSAPSGSKEQSAASSPPPGTEDHGSVQPQEFRGDFIKQSDPSGEIGQSGPSGGSGGSKEVQTILSDLTDLSLNARVEIANTMEFWKMPDVSYVDGRAVEGQLVSVATQELLNFSKALERAKNVEGKSMPNYMIERMDKAFMKAWKAERADPTYKDQASGWLRWVYDPKYHRYQLQAFDANGTRQDIRKFKITTGMLWQAFKDARNEYGFKYRDLIDGLFAEV